MSRKVSEIICAAAGRAPVTVIVVESDTLLEVTVFDDGVYKTVNKVCVTGVPFVSRLTDPAAIKPAPNV